MAKKEEKVTQIIRAATQEFMQKGLDAASMQHISEKAAVSKRTLYKYYPSKEDLYFALIDEVLDRVDEMYQIKFSIDVCVKEQFEAIVAKKIELTLAPSFINISRIIFGELLKGRAPKPEQMQRLNQSEMVLVEWIEQGQKAGKITSEFEAAEIADQFHSILKGKIYWPVLFCIQQREELDVTAIQATVMKFFISSFAA